MSRDYIIVTGYWNGPHWLDGKERPEEIVWTKNFFNLWWDNTYKYALPKEVLVINQNSHHLPEVKKGKWIDTLYNLGHVHSLDKNDYPIKKFAGCSVTFMMAALYCFNSNCDFIYKEQDCLAFGNWIERLYSELESKNAKMLIGRPEDAAGQTSAQSVFIIKHEFLLDFVKSYISIDFNDAGPNYMRPEVKFTYLKNIVHPKSIQFMTMGYDRSRPSDFNEETYYIQQVRAHELEKLKELGKI